MQSSIKLPRQRLSYDEKKKDNFKWGRDCIDAITLGIYSTQASGEGTYHTDIKRKLVNYKLYNNQIEQEDFEKDCNPFGITSEEYKDIIQPYNKTYNKINVLVGEEWKRPFNYKSFLVNGEASIEFNRHQTKLLREYLQTSLDLEIAKLQAEYAQQQQAKDEGQEQGQQQSPEEEAQEKQAQAQELQEKINALLDPEQIKKYMQTDWRAASEIMSDEILQYLFHKLDIKKLKNFGFKHTHIAGEEFAWTGVINGEPVVKLLNPVKFFFQKSAETEYVQDGFYAGYRTRMTLADVLDEYQNALTDKEKDKLESLYTTTNLYGITDSFLRKELDYQDLNLSLDWRLTKGGTTSATSYLGQYGSSLSTDVDVVHVEWRSQRKVGFKHVISEEGEPSRLKLVDEKYKLPSSAKKVKYTDKNGEDKVKYVFQDEITQEFIELEWTWIPEIWEATRIANDIYVNVRPKPFQYRSLDNPFKVKLGYHGLVYNATNAANISTMDRMKPFQYLYFIVMHKMKQILAADAPPLINIDMSMIPKKLTNEQYMYYNKLGINFYDPNQNNEGNPTTGQSGQKGVYETERSTMQHVAQYINILNALDEQIGEVAGVTRQREGQTSQYESVTGTQSAIVQSSHITEPIFTAHNLLWGEILTSLLETTILCWKDEVKHIPIVLSDMSRKVIEFNGEQFIGKDLGIFITDNETDNQALNKMRDLALELLQNGTKATDVMSLYRATSAEAWERNMKALEKQRDELAAQQEKYKSEAQERALKLEIEAREDVQSHEWDMQERKYEHEKELAAMEVYKFQKELDANSDGEPDFLAAQIKEREILSKERLERDKINANQLNDNLRMQHEKEMKDKDLQIADKDNATKIKVAAMKPKPKPASKKK